MNELINTYEKKGFKNRLKETLMLSFIVIITFIASLVTMDILVLPIAALAVGNKALFTLYFQYAFWILISLSLFFLLIKRIQILKKDGYPASYIVKNILYRPFSLLFTFIFILLITLFIIIIINFLYQNNYYLIYKLINL